MKNGLFLDDERLPDDVFWVKYPDNINWKIVRSYSDFESSLNEGSFDIISFDHDLQDFVDGKEYTGYDALKKLVDLCIEKKVTLSECYFHTQNPIGRNNMSAYWENFMRHYFAGDFK